MTRDEARDLFKKTGISLSDLRVEDFRSLKRILRSKLKASGLIRGSFKIDPRLTFQKNTSGVSVNITCSSFYFEKREAISFNPDGFIGFAGWADSVNVVPILEGFAAWVEDISERKIHHFQSSVAESA